MNLTKREQAIIQALIAGAKKAGFIEYETETLRVTITRFPKPDKKRRKS